MRLTNLFTTAGKGYYTYIYFFLRQNLVYLKIIKFVCLFVACLLKLYEFFQSWRDIFTLDLIESELYISASYIAARIQQVEKTI